MPAPTPGALAPEHAAALRDLLLAIGIPSGEADDAMMTATIPPRPVVTWEEVERIDALAAAHRLTRGEIFRGMVQQGAANLEAKLATGRKPSLDPPANDGRPPPSSSRRRRAPR